MWRLPALRLVPKVQEGCLMACPGCDSIETPTLLGELGRLVWVRCRECGIDFNMSAAALEDQADDMGTTL